MDSSIKEETCTFFIQDENFIKCNSCGAIIFCSEDMQQEYGSREEFEAKANIDGVLLKDLWADVSFAGFMYCG